VNDASLRKTLVELLEGGHAHVDPKAALAKVAKENRARRPAGLHSVWEELEHMRIAQEDILRYTLEHSWKSPEFPAGYWPKEGEAPSDAVFESSVARFFEDLDSVVALATDPARDLTREIPHGEGRTYLRQLLLVADHNAYHLGQLVAVRKILGDWPS
jgi:uncharacterized damage-inducible protein DinB